MAEPYLGNTKNTTEVIRKYDFAFQKRFGQNFLIDTHVIDKIVSGAEITKDDCVLEIGPGIGTLTQYLADKARHVIVVEIDKSLIPVLHDTLKDWNNIEIINDDIMKVDIKKLAEERNGGRPIKVVANLPYYITTPIIMKLLENDIPVSSVTVMIQKEVADRMRALPGSKDYGALTLSVNYYAGTSIVANVPCNCFIPRPKVDSTVIRLDKLEEPKVKVKDRKLMFELIRASFNQRRKTFANGVKNAGNLDFKRDEIEEALLKCGLPETIRGEKMSIDDFAKVSDLLTEKR